MDINNSFLLDTFLDYVKISSESGNELEICDRLFDDLCNLSLNPKKYEVTNNYQTNGYNIYCFVEGSIDAEPLLLNAHVDTVAPGNNVAPLIEDGIIKSKGKTILGGDDKTGIACILNFLHYIKEEGLEHRSFEVLFTVGEEAGLFGAKGFDLSIIKSKIAYTFDSSNPVGGMIVVAPSNYKMDIEIYGRSAHAGRAPEEGVNAIQVASKAVAKIPLLRVDKDTVCNIGSFISDFKNNVVPDRAKLSLMARSLDDDKLIKLTECIEKEFNDACDGAGAKLKFVKKQSYQMYRKSKDEKSVKHFIKVMNKMGIKPYDIEACGGSDTHILNFYGIDAINLGVGNQKVHSHDEHISIEQLILCSEMVKELVLTF